MKTILILFSLFFLLYVVRAQTFISSGVNCTDRRIIVNVHNNFRLRVANGLVPGQPRASNMKLLAWDNKLGVMAQNYANKMKFSHNPNRTDSRFAVGENLYMSMTTSSRNTGYNWQAAVQAWFDEYKLYVFGSGFSSQTGHYTQVVWANTMLIGCGASYFRSNGWYTRLYVCNYGPAGNWVGQNPYIVGTGCTNLCYTGDRTKIYGSCN